MPVDLKQIGPPKQYPSADPGIRTWLVVWVTCIVIIDAVVLLLWPKNTPAQGGLFWLLVAGLPNAIFFALVAWNRAHYESAHLHVLYYNDHREQRRKALIEDGQRSLNILGYCYRLPLKDEMTFASTIIDGAALVKAQALRDGSAIVRHTRLPDDMEIDASHPPLIQIQLQAMLTRESKLYVQLISPLANTLRALACAGLYPAVRLVTGNSNTIDQSLQQLGAVLEAYGLCALELAAATDGAGLMLVDAWLDAKEARPLLVLAVQLNDVPPEESAEGGVAVLLACGQTRLPEDVMPHATLHRPVTTGQKEMAESIALATLWGNADPEKIGHAWVTGFESDQHTLISTACRLAGMTSLARHASRYNQDQVIGYAGVAAGWLALVAAAEYVSDHPQMILSRTQTIEIAILSTHPTQHPV